MRRLTVFLSLLVLLGMACAFGGSVRPTPVPTLEIQTQPQKEVQPDTPSPSPASTTKVEVPGNSQVLEGPNINYNGIRFTLDPAMGSRLQVFNDETSLNGATAHNIRFALAPQEYCQTWCLMVYPVAEFKQAFGSFVFPPDGYRGGAAVIFQAQETALSFQNGSGDRGLETFGQDHYGVSNESLKYIFRGYSADRQYGIYLQVPIHTTSLPQTAPTLTAGSQGQDILEYNRQAALSINALGPSDFTPNLDLLDALVASIHVEAP